MTNNPVRKALLERRVTIGSWLQINHPTPAEILANVGFEWIGADLEHADIDVVSFTALLRAMHGRGTVPFARVPSNDTILIRRVLDVGAQGVLVPLVNTPEEAERAVQAAKYPPRGVRGYCFSRMNNWGADFDDYVRRANDDIAVVVMIESKQAVENIDAILAVDGVDGVFIGPYDMSGSYGIPGETSDPIVQEACRKVIDACARAKKSAGLHVVFATPDAIRKAIADGFTFICLGVDGLFMDQAARAAKQAAEEAVNQGSG